MGFLSSFLGLDAQKDARKSASAQRGIANRQMGAMDQALPYYGGVLQFLSQNAGMQSPRAPMAAMGQEVAQPRPGAGFGTADRMQGAAQPSAMDQLAQMRAQAGARPVGGARQPGVNPDGAPAPGVLPNSALGVYGSNPADVYRMQQAEEEVNRLADSRARMLQYRLGQQGIGNSATAGAALARNESSALNQLADFRRNLAMNAGGEQERRVQQLLAAMGMGVGMGGQASAGFGQSAAMSQQQSQNQQQQLMSLLPLFF